VRQAECFEFEGNPRQPTANPLPQAEKRRKPKQAKVKKKDIKRNGNF